jgi:hypothetical protein
MSNTIGNEQQQAHSLRNLYFTRTAVQLLWAGIVIATAAGNSPRRITDAPQVVPEFKGSCSCRHRMRMMA